MAVAQQTLAKNPSASTSPSNSLVLLLINYGKLRHFVRFGVFQSLVDSLANCHHLGRQM